MNMATENTVTISIDEYFDLRQKAYMNDFLIGELNRIQERFNQYDRMHCELAEEVRKLKDGK